MLIPVKILSKIWKVRPRGVLHVGAHEAEELEEYEKFNWLPVLWIEAQPNKVQYLQNMLPKDNHQVLQAAVWDQSGVNLFLNVMTNTMSTSLLNLETHAIEYPHIKLSQRISVLTQTLSDIVPVDFEPDLIALDIQGAELRALKGFHSRLHKVKWVYSEVNAKPLYSDCCMVNELDDFLAGYHFDRVATRWTQHGWGDALYVSRANSSRPAFRERVLWSLLQGKWKLRNASGRLQHALKKLLRPGRI